MKIIDMHCDTLWLNWEYPSKDFVSGDSAINLKLLAENGSLAQCFAMYLPWKEKGQDPYDILQSMYQHYCRLMEEHKALIRPACSAEDILKNHEEGRLSSILTIEEGGFLDGKMERLYEAYDMGVRLITLTWNYENSLAFPNSADSQLHQKGLKPFGFEVVEEMNRLGMMVDVSHLSEGGFYDVAKHSRKPFCASHSSARALCSHQRNLTDDQLKTLGNTGSIVGVNFEQSFLNESDEDITFDRIIEHLLHMKNKAGIEAIGFGSDFDGIEPNGELTDYSGFPLLLEKMAGPFTYDEIDKISHQNMLRVLREVTGR